MQKIEEQLWQQLNTRSGELARNPDHINAFNDKDDEKMKERLTRRMASTTEREGREEAGSKEQERRRTTTEEAKHTTLQQLLSISYHFAPNFFVRCDETQEDGLPTTTSILQQEKILELYIVLSESTLEQWLQLGRSPSVYMEKGTDDRHTWCNFHTRLEYAINDFLNIPTSSSTSTPTTIPDGNTHDRTVDYRAKQRLEGTTTMTLRMVYEENIRSTVPNPRRQTTTTNGQSDKICDYMEIKTTYKQRRMLAIMDKPGYKQHHFQDYSVIIYYKR
eukprot:5191276-Amphidinium_carterae.2